MAGSLWLTLFHLKEQANQLRPAGLYGAAFVSYDEGSPLTYHELLVARPVSTVEHGRRVTITDIWVDSPASVAGGRELWAIPKGCATSPSTPPTPARCRPPSGAPRSGALRSRAPGSATCRAPYPGCRSRAAPGSRGSRTPAWRSAPPRCRARRRRSWPGRGGISTPTGLWAGWSAPGSWRRSGRRRSGCCSGELRVVRVERRVRAVNSPI
ncbi:MAG TPA: hypothetical protein DEQ43_19155 [Nocardioides bacterium]|nr:hypothetical protein [Nocardioides sp.]